LARNSRFVFAQQSADLSQGQILRIVAAEAQSISGRERVNFGHHRAAYDVRVLPRVRVLRGFDRGHRLRLIVNGQGNGPSIAPQPIDVAL